MKSEKGMLDIIIGLAVAGIIIGAIIGLVMWSWKTTYGNVQTTEIVVKDKYIKRGTGKESEDTYLIVDTDKNTYKISDLTFIGKWNSTDLYNQLEIGKKYKIETSGIRNQFLSMYKNINKIEEIEE